jgi:hypothetical protein
MPLIKHLINELSKLSVCPYEVTENHFLGRDE